MYSHQVLDIDTAIATWGAEWNALADRVRDATLFQCPCAVRAWRAHYGASVSASVIVVTHGKSLVGVLPIMSETVWRGPTFSPRTDYASYDREFAARGTRLFPVRQVSPVLSWRASAIRPQLLCSDDERVSVCRAVAERLITMRSLDVAVLPAMTGPDVTAWAEGFRAAGAQTFVHDLERQVFTLETLRSVPDLISGQSANARRNLRRTLKRANDAGVTITDLVGQEAVANRIDDLRSVADRSWKNLAVREGVATFSHDKRQQNYLSDLMPGDDSGVVPVLSLAEHKGAVIAAAMWFRHGSTQTGLYVFRDERALPLGLGHLLVADGCEKALAAGISRIDFNATQDWVRPWSDTSRTISNVIWFGNTARAQIYRRIAKARGRIQSL